MTVFRVANETHVSRLREPIHRKQRCIKWRGSRLLPARRVWAQYDAVQHAGPTNKTSLPLIYDVATNSDSA
jgi:hypothetical protein